MDFSGILCSEQCHEMLLRFQMVFEHTLEPIIFHQNGIVIDGNAAAAKLLGGTSREALSGKPLIDFFHPDDRYEALRRIKKMEEADIQVDTSDLRISQPDGRQVSVEVRSVLLDSAEGKVFCVTMQDITDRKGTEGALDGREQIWRTLIERALFGIIVAQLDGKFIEVNSPLCEMTGFSRRELLDLQLDDLFVDVLHLDPLTLWERIRLGDTVSVKRELRRKDPRPLPVEVYLGLVTESLVQIIVRDISERSGSEPALVENEESRRGSDKTHTEATGENREGCTCHVEAKRALWESEEKFRNLVVQSPAGIYILQDDRFVYTNPSFAEAFGHTQEQLTAAESLYEFVQEDDYDLVALQIQRRLSGEIHSAHYTLRGKHRNGSTIYLDVIGTVTEYQGRPAIIGTALDVTEKKRSEKALRESEQRYRNLIEQASDGIFILQNGCLCEVNTRACEMTGYTREELLAMRFEDVLHLETPEEKQAVWCDLRKGHILQFESTYCRKDESLFPVEISIKLIEEDLVQAIVRDISERKLAEEELRDSRTFLNSVIENLPIQIFVKDAVSLRYLRHNRASEELFGFDPDEVVGKTDYDLFTKDEADFLTQIDQEVLEKRELVEIPEEPVQTRGKGERILRMRKLPIMDAAGDPQYILGISEDITDQRHAAEALRASEKRYRTLMEQASDAIFLIDPETGMLVDANRKACELLGYTINELRQMYQADLHPREDRNFYLSLYDRYSSQEAIPVRDLYVVHRNGRHIPVGISASAIDVGGRSLIQGIFRDITEQLRYEAELVEAKEKAEEMNRLKSAFLANMSHEIRTPLTSIIGFADILAEEVPSAYREFARLIHTSGRRLLETLNSVLDLAQLESRTLKLNPEPLNVSAQLRETVELFGQQAHERGLRLVIQVPSEPIEVILDRAALGRVLNNLISNAIKFTRKGGVTISAETHRESIIIRVEDTGVGISASFLPHIFDEFKQESDGLGRDFEGSGLGMTITKRLVEMMSGCIEVSSEKGKGTCFTITLPLEQTSEDTLSAEETGCGTNQAPVKRRVLIVDDDPHARTLISRLLRNDFHVDVATGSESCLVRARHSKYDFVLLDINLGEGPTGVDVLRSLRTIPAYRHVPVIALTAYALPGDRDTFLREGFSDYISKPFTKDQLITAILRSPEQRQQDTALDPQ